MRRGYDLIVIGAGPAGWSAATQASKLGLDILVVDRGRRVGGRFVESGTIPSKILREIAVKRHRLAHAAARDRAPEAPTPSQVAEWVEKGIENHLPTLEQLLGSSTVDVRWGSASFVSPTEVRVATADGEECVGAAKIIVATGSKPRRPPGFHFDGSLVCDFESILHMHSVPASLAVIGAGLVGCEMACTFAALGSSVTLVDRRRRILRMLDGEIAEIVIGEMERMGIRLLLGEPIEEARAERGTATWKATVQHGEAAQLTADRVLVALGREPNTLPLDLAKAGVAIDEAGWIKVDDRFRTTAPGVYAVGDVTGSVNLGGASAHQGRLAVLHAAGRTAAAVSDLPITLYTIPETAMIGLTEEGCRELGLAYAVGRARYSEVPRSHITGADEGLLKLIVRREDRVVVGAHVVGELASELIQLASLLVSRRGTVDALVEAPYAYPTLAQLYQLAAMDASAQL